MWLHHGVTACFPDLHQLNSCYGSKKPHGVAGVLLGVIYISLHKGTSGLHPEHSRLCGLAMPVQLDWAIHYLKVASQLTVSPLEDPSMNKGAFCLHESSQWKKTASALLCHLSILVFFNCLCIKCSLKILAKSHQVIKTPSTTTGNFSLPFRNS